MWSKGTLVCALFLAITHPSHNSRYKHMHNFIVYIVSYISSYVSIGFILSASTVSTLSLYVNHYIIQHTVWYKTSMIYHSQCSAQAWRERGQGLQPCRDPGQLGTMDIMGHVYIYACLLWWRKRDDVTKGSSDIILSPVSDWQSTVMAALYRIYSNSVSWLIDHWLID